MKQFSREINPREGLKVYDLPDLLNMPKELADELIVVGGHRKLNEDELIHDGEEVTLFLQIMGG